MRIGLRAATTNDTIDATHHAYWTPAADANGTLDAFAVGQLAHGERGVEAAVALGDDHPFERLQALAVALLDLDLHHQGIARGEVRNLALHLFRFELLDDIAHDL